LKGKVDPDAGLSANQQHKAEYEAEAEAEARHHRINKKVPSCGLPRCAM
jgi:hypothetical protein